MQLSFVDVLCVYVDRAQLFSETTNPVYPSMPHEEKAPSIRAEACHHQ